ncbi:MULTISPECIES: amino acid aminotransferase [Serratia]|jgi:aromatic-amino-acid transaminase|uniref:Aminotransferase n=1 Tax=Serratia fonticola TaxID=47917 RepID=A0ABY9PJB1_SERFO|nr:MULTISPECIES: amino acid aminotransferase [Serratia]MBC3232002.1 aspartate/tyrosine/aromatic aminotransferase [Serratia fonticola]MCO7512785.1 aspartate/tyrosine/aromatic aminotransferase [Serratia fonticola]OCJ46552.1 aromatic amino acid aminotransferase [Serratia sp. 14-2641]WMT12947.1 amino acid aminotransferase [Serratia fonticola]CAI1627404.1 Tyrosine aminotransferase [Serratia fonticola]
MFDHITPSTPDPIMSLMEAYMQDANPQKVNLGIGLYYDHQGNIPLMQAVHIAEQRLLEQQRPHTYPPIEGSALFARQIQTLLFGEPVDRIATVQSVGGSGALKLGADFIYHYLARREIWVSDPTWANHWAIFEGAGLKVNTYPYFDDASGELRFAAMLDTLSALPEGAVVLLHPCCHNPTGTDLSPAQWQAVIEVVQRRRLLPFFDIAYQGFGDGLDEDCFALRAMLKTDVDFLVSNSFSKNVALYGQRLGGLSVRCATAEAAVNVKGALKTLIRRSYSCPPTHGSQIVETLLADPQLYQLWASELTTMRQRIKQMRVGLAAGLEQGGTTLDYTRIRDQKGMFSYTGLNERQLGQLRQQYSIYLVAPGRMCLPGLNQQNLDYVAAAILDVTRTA